ncbi:unnamed protein product [Notodromas monacha]|uniref:WAP domain-containing protein n=1 Tax=Notodromas monacha TaxID=399045 RepID=A0A7R9BXA5_9CRUS|nr:unnamed protein product [Notodromas monacha]CAG0922094.1 unnamed protein product [Notodromas monacha]
MQDLGSGRVVTLHMWSPSEDATLGPPHALSRPHSSKRDEPFSKRYSGKFFNALTSNTGINSDCADCSDLDCENCRVQKNTDDSEKNTQEPNAGLQCPPPTEERFGICVESCSSDKDCSKRNQLCCSNGCGHSCVEGISSNYCSLNCNDGFKCIKYFPICYGSACPETPTAEICVPSKYMTCAEMDCAHHCRNQEVTCFTAPCYPVPQCSAPSRP